MADVNVFDGVTVAESITVRLSEVFAYYDAQNHWLSLWINGIEMARFKSTGDIDLHGTKVPNAF